ncbi:MULTISPECIES: stage III sporulation protein AD [Tissierellales]|jgi:stage III sporulation protein AD|uniref:Stage III sporulation protein AD n=1 Tax=Acidilutibacter cellobiosedens TaxID=2507161 RepID=A0A410QCI3_9FIRM|nr:MULTISPECIES: stage III sporulation protein AD [Tissierellales]MBE6082588.1 stage III sporulation protein AD [Tissierellaceae bacterium]QAT61772.1 stage III sporulation protein AD [Acidilutibacter cellobiosedens]SCL82317.1 stage III sporulation protein AD [Sporanaerobacter sp. PP17-6a]
MDIFRIVGIGLIATVIIVVLKGIRPEYALLVSVATGIIIFSMVIDKLFNVVQVLSNLAQRANVDFAYFTTILKIIGISYVVEFGAQISKDAGEENIANKIELGGKVIIMVISMPIFIALMDMIIKIFP